MNAQAVAATLAAQADAVRARLDRFIRLPSVSTDPAYAGGMRGTQELLLAWLREINGNGRDTVQPGRGDRGGGPSRKRAAAYGPTLLR